MEEDCQRLKTWLEFAAGRKSRSFCRYHYSMVMFKMLVDSQEKQRSWLADNEVLSASCMRLLLGVIELY